MVNGFDLSSFNVFFVGELNYEVSDYNALPHMTHVSEVVEVFQFNFEEDLIMERTATMEFPIQSKGDFKNLVVAFWFKLWMDDDNMIDSGPQAYHSHWGQAFQYLGNCQIGGDGLMMAVTHDAGRISFKFP